MTASFLSLLMKALIVSVVIQTILRDAKLNLMSVSSARKPGIRMGITLLELLRSIVNAPAATETR